VSWESRVYLAKRRIAKKRIEETCREIQARYGAGIVEDDDGELGDDDEYVFARFRFRLVRDREAGLYFLITSDDVSSNDRDVEDAGACMSEWAQLLGGEISEGEWNARREKAEEERVVTHKLPKHGPADTLTYFAFDADGNARGKKSISKEIHGHVRPKILESTWLVENAILRVECVSYGPEGTIFDHITYEVDRRGMMRRVSDG
jgi:hypothetical protein